MILEYYTIIGIKNRHGKEMTVAREIYPLFPDDEEKEQFFEKYKPDYIRIFKDLTVEKLPFE